MGIGREETKKTQRIIQRMKGYKVEVKLKVKTPVRSKSVQRSRSQMKSLNSARNLGRAKQIDEENERLFVKLVGT